jgi:hypothetical protein
MYLWPNNGAIPRVDGYNDSGIACQISGFEKNVGARVVS